MRRRDLLGAVPALLSPATGARAAGLLDSLFPDFTAILRRQARALAATPFTPPVNTLPPALEALTYDGYRDLRFRPEMAVWRDEGLPFQLQMFARAGKHADTVGLYEVVRGRAVPIAYRPGMFSSGPLAPPLDGDLGFGGFRIHAPLNAPDRYDEFAVFQGASYFRAVPKGGVYGLSARGLEIGSGDPGEEFPAFRSFYIERPLPEARSVVVHALMDSPSVAGAYRFMITPGDPTVFEVELALYPRVELKRAGLGALTSMYLYGAEQPRRFDDFRPQVHDSDGLLVATSAQERLWRPLANPPAVEVLPLGGASGFGLMQRQRALGDYEDLEALYHRRPGAWLDLAPANGEGEVRLVQLPSHQETDDNIVASWRPAAALAAGAEHRFAYRLAWGSAPEPPSPLAAVTLWRDGAGSTPGQRRFVLEFAGTPDAALATAAPEVRASAGEVRNVTLQPGAEPGLARLTFELAPAGIQPIELSARLTQDGRSATETWLGRWRG